MKIKVDKLSFSEFSEYAESTFARPIKMALSFFIGLAVVFIIICMGNEELKSSITPLWWCVGIMVFLLIASGAGLSLAFKKSGLDKTAASYVLEEEILKISLGKIKGNLEWKYVKKVKETKNLWIMTVPNGQFIMPKRCTGEGFENFISSVLPEDKIKRLKYRRKRETVKGTEDGEHSDN